MTNSGTILLIDDDALLLQSYQDILKEEGYCCILANTGSAGIKKVQTASIDLVITDLRMPDLDGIAVLRAIREFNSHLPVIVVTGYPDLQSAVEAVRLGAFDYISKPLAPAELLMAVKLALKNRRLLLENNYLRQSGDSLVWLQGVIGKSIQMQEIMHQVRRVAPTNCTVLILGESGVGKEVIARTIHRESDLAEKQFVVVDCPALSPTILESELFGHVRGAFTGATETKSGLFEVANGGTLFLDEIANIPLEIQGKLLRFLETNEYKPVGSSSIRIAEVRLIAATSGDLDEAMRQGNFRKDLFYRLNVFPINIPPLRERREDIRLLAQHFLEHFTTNSILPKPCFTEESLALMGDYAWPGNVRELRNLVERSLVLADGPAIDVTKIINLNSPASTLNGNVPRTAEELKQAKEMASKQAVSQIESAFIIAALRATGGNVTESAKQTDMQRTYFQALMRRHNISRAQIVSES